MKDFWVVALVIAINVIIWIPMLIWIRRKSARLITEIQDDLLMSGEHEVIGPETVFLWTPWLGRLGAISSNAIAVLTEKRLIIRPITRSGFDIPLADIAEVKESKWYQASARGGYTHIIIRMNDDKDLALQVKDPQRWLEGLGRRD